ncbi:hypothetical protein [Motilimonas sp. KMU-193]|uniref:hypothetical protein n=1 Tax=Motilimonas sp. KMU-193 TaxID=3388668 RepID=UPI00396B3E99
MKLLLTLVLFFAFIPVIMKLTAPPDVTKNFIEQAPRFYVLGKKDEQFQKLALQDAIEQQDEFTYSLDQQEVELNVGDIHKIKVLSTKNGTQLIEFNYINTYSSTSTYQVTGNQIKPIRYQINHHMGQAFFYPLAIIPAYLLSSLVFAWRARRRAKRLVEPQ